MLMFGEYLEFNANIKGTVHSKMKIHSLSTDPHGDGRLGEVFLVHKTLLEFHRKRASQLSLKQLK